MRSLILIVHLIPQIQTGVPGPESRDRSLQNTMVKNYKSCLNRGWILFYGIKLLDESLAPYLGVASLCCSALFSIMSEKCLMSLSNCLELRVSIT